MGHDKKSAAADHCGLHQQGAFHGNGEKPENIEEKSWRNRGETHEQQLFQDKQTRADANKREESGKKIFQAGEEYLRGNGRHEQPGQLGQNGQPLLPHQTFQAAGHAQQQADRGDGGQHGAGR
jgi:hypothetical protein